jgi:hypothetical protein
MIMEKFVYVQSDESNSFFPDNQAWKFKVHLDVPLTFNGFWKIGLIEFNVNVKTKKTQKSPITEALYVYSNICKESIIQGSEQPILRRLNPNTTYGWDYIFDFPIYLPVKRKELREFELYIMTNDGSLATFLDSPVNLTLHFKRYPFYTDHESL